MIYCDYNYVVHIPSIKPIYKHADAQNQRCRIACTQYGQHNRGNHQSTIRRNDFANGFHNQAANIIPPSLQILLSALAGWMEKK